MEVFNRVYDERIGSMENYCGQDSLSRKIRSTQMHREVVTMLLQKAKLKTCWGLTHLAH